MFCTSTNKFWLNNLRRIGNGHIIESSNNYTAIRIRYIILLYIKSLTSLLFILKLTHWGRDKLSPFCGRYFQMHLKMFDSLKVSLKYIFKVQFSNITALVHIIAWCRPGGKPLSEPMMVSLLTHIYASRGLNLMLYIARDSTWILNSLRAGDTYMNEWARDRLTKAYGVTMQRYRKSRPKIIIKRIFNGVWGQNFCVKFQICPLKFHTKCWTHTSQNMHLTRC